MSFLFSSTENYGKWIRRKWCMFLLVSFNNILKVTTKEVPIYMYIGGNQTYRIPIILSINNRTYTYLFLVTASIKF